MEKMMHSYIISGDGDAARSRARELAAAALCESSGAKPCRACRHCRKVFQGAFPGIHPDVALVERAADKSGKLRREITVDQIRALAVDAAVLPNEADGKDHTPAMRHGSGLLYRNTAFYQSYHDRCRNRCRGNAPTG